MHENQLISALPKRDRTRMLSVCEPVELVLGQVLCEEGQTTRHVYFPTESFVSLIVEMDDKHRLEVGMVGSEGMVGVQVALGLLRDPLDGLVQGAGMSWRIEVGAFRHELERNASLQGSLRRYVSVMMGQRATAAACLRFHEIGPRLSRWLLMSHDRSHVDQFPVTQQFLSMMLGVRRVGVTAAAGKLAGRGLIEYRRGRLTVLDRLGLEAAACACYAADELAYATTMSPR